MLYRFIILLLIALCIKYYINYTKNSDDEKKVIEEMENITIEFLDRNTACKVLIDESNGKYISNHTLIEMKAKRCIDEEDIDMNYSPNRLIHKCRLSYCNNILEFTGDEKDSISKLVKKLSSKMRIHYPKFRHNNWRFIKITDKLEDGLPHTRSDCIILPQSCLNRLIKYQKNGQDKLEMIDVGGTLIHEKTHILQRYFPETFEKLYKDIWPFHKANNIYGVDKDNPQLSNPDALDEIWIYKGNKEWILPRATLHPKNKFQGNSYDIGIKLKRIGNGDFVKIDEKPIRLDSVKDYDSKFCNIQRNNHPNEISATSISKIALHEMKYKNLSDSKLECLKPFKKWMDEQFKKYNPQKY
jgi:hypothetical protein